MIRQPLRPIAQTGPKSEIYNFILSKYLPILEAFKTGTGEVGSTTPIPSFAVQDLILLSQTATRLLKVQAPVLNLRPGVIIVGDLHGNLLNLFHILSQHGMPPEQKYLFLGNIVNFGEFSLETVTLVLALFCAYPTSVTILRGDSEMYPIQTINSLHDEIKNFYENQDLFKALQTAFSFMPLAALFNGSVLCTQCTTLKRYGSVINMKAQKGPTLCESNADGFTGYVEGSQMPSEDWLYSFLEKNYLDILILGGNVEETGISMLCEERVLSVATCESEGAAGIILLTGDLKPSSVIFVSNSTLVRGSAVFKKIDKCLKAPIFTAPQRAIPSKNGRYISASPGANRPSIIIPSKNPLASSVMRLKSNTPKPLMKKIGDPTSSVVLNVV